MLHFILTFFTFSNLTFSNFSSPFAVLDYPASNHLTKATVVKVVDGDTLRLKEGTYLRLCGVDAPEISHSSLPSPDPNKQRQYYWGNISKAYLQTLIKDNSIYFNTVNLDKYNRVVAEVYLKNEYTGNLTNVEQTLLSHGMVRLSPNYYKSCSNPNSLLQSQKEAILNVEGQWADPMLLSPWEFRSKY